MLLEEEQKILEITQQLHDLCIDAFHKNNKQQAFIIWKALFIAAAKNFLPQKAFSIFLLQTTKTILPMLDTDSITEVLGLYEVMVMNDAVEMDDRSDAHAFEGDLKKAKKISSKQPIIPNTLEDCPVTLLRCYTSAYQCEKVGKNEKLATANKITQCEKTILSDYFIYTWQTYETFFTHQITADEYYQTLCWVKNFIQCNQHYLQTENKTPDWQRYRESLNNYRNECVAALPTLPLQNENDVDQVITAQKQFNQHMRDDFVTTIIKDGFSMLGEPPCATAFLAGGSLGRNELMLFSDLDLIILLPPNELKKPLVKAYFAALIKLFEFKLQSLGESARRSEPKGILLDDGISPGFDKTEPVRAIGSCDEIIQEFGPGFVVNGMQFEKIRSANFYSILHTTYICGRTKNNLSGKDLYKQYQQAIQDHLNSTLRPNLTVREALVQQHLPKHIEDLIHKKSGPIKKTDAFAIKEEMASFLYYIAFDLAYHFNLSIENTIDNIYHTNDVWQALADANIIDEVMASFAKRCYALAMILNIQAENFYGQQIKPKLIALSQDARKTVFDWTAPPNWWGTFGLSAAAIPDQLKDVFLHPSIENIFALDHKTYLQIAATEWLLIQPLIRTLQAIDVNKPFHFQSEDFLKKHFIELLQLAINSQPSALEDFANCVKDYVHFTKYVIPLTIDDILKKITLDKLSTEKQLLVLNILGCYCLIENKPFSLDFTPLELNTLLHKAIRYQQLGAIKLLLRAGASVTLQDEVKQTALHTFARLAISFPTDDVLTACQLLLGYATTSIDLYDQIGYTPLLCLVDHAEEASDLIKQLIFMFIKKGANINAVNFVTGESALDRLLFLQHTNGFESVVFCGATQLTHIDSTLRFIETKFPAERKKQIFDLLEQHNHELAWRHAIYSVTQSQKEKDCQLIVGSKSGPRYLSNQLESFTLEFGRHKIHGIKNKDQQKLVLKYEPEIPGNEITVSKIAHFLFGHGVPHSELFKIPQHKSHSIPLLISQYIPGENLQHVLTSPDWSTKLAQLDPTRYWEMIFLSLLVLWEDGIPSNFKLVPFINAEGKTVYHVVCVDNDHAFVPPKVLNKQDIYELQAKCILWFFPQINTPIDPKARANFLKHNPFVFFKYLLESLNIDQKNHFALFNDKTDREYFLFKQGENKQTTVSIAIRKHIKKTFTQCLRMERFLRKNPNATGLEFIQYVVPSIGNIIINAYHAGNTPIEKFKAIKKFAHVSIGESKSGVHHTLASATDILKMQEIPLKDMLDENNIHGPAYALEDLQILANEFDQLLTVKDQLLKANFAPYVKIINPELKEKALRSFSFSVLKNIDQHKSFINILKRGGYYKLTIRDSSVLTDKDLLEILKASPDLISLTLINCSQITNHIFTVINQFGLSLQQLNLQQLVNLKENVVRRQDELGFSDTIPHFDLCNLKEIYIQDCPIKELYIDGSPQLKSAYFSLPLTHSIRIFSHQLQILEVKHCTKLDFIKTDSKELKSLRILNCPKLPLKGVIYVSENKYSLEKFVCTGNPNFVLTDFLTKYPFLLQEPIGEYSELLQNKELLKACDKIISHFINVATQYHKPDLMVELKNLIEKNFFLFLKNYQSFQKLCRTFHITSFDLKENVTTPQEKNLDALKDDAEIIAMITGQSLLCSDISKLKPSLLLIRNSNNRNAQLVIVNALKYINKASDHLFVDDLLNDLIDISDDDETKKLIIDVLKSYLSIPQVADTITRYLIQSSEVNNWHSAFDELLEAAAPFCEASILKNTYQDLLSITNSEKSNVNVKVSAKRLCAMYAPFIEPKQTADLTLQHPNCVNSSPLRPQLSYRDVNLLISSITHAKHLDQIILTIKTLKDMNPLDHAEEMILYILEVLQDEKNRLINVFLDQDMYDLEGNAYVKIICELLSSLQQFTPFKHKAVCSFLLTILNEINLKENIVKKIAEVLVAYRLDANKDYLLHHLFAKLNDMRRPIQTNGVTVLKAFAPYFSNEIISEILKFWPYYKRWSTDEKRIESISILLAHAPSADIAILKNLTEVLKQQDDLNTMFELINVLLKTPTTDNFSHAITLILQYCNMKDFSLNGISYSHRVTKLPKIILEIWEAIQKNDTNHLLKIQDSVNQHPHTELKSYFDNTFYPSIFPEAHSSFASLFVEYRHFIQTELAFISSFNAENDYAIKEVLKSLNEAFKPEELFNNLMEKDWNITIQTSMSSWKKWNKWFSLYNKTTHEELNLPEVSQAPSTPEQRS